MSSRTSASSARAVRTTPTTPTKHRDVGLIKLALLNFSTSTTAAIVEYLSSLGIGYKNMEDFKIQQLYGLLCLQHYSMSKGQVAPYVIKRCEHILNVLIVLIAENAQSVELTSLYVESCARIIGFYNDASYDMFTRIDDDAHKALIGSISDEDRAATRSQFEVMFEDYFGRLKALLPVESE